ncbi:cytochrome P450 [Didymella exigua CBS 183.55]|uniref:Cytochrome P450 n=1 Tax=Didymella exigua CBS 183.55 TaxID=1150837 RepID=A0A6A5R776_9PLEO|nr:cytochrome P450 [Didymella exigua CBS 183.55]KAF1923473.1 cytochrome P450 [Didymella exigua CBS 183.55]
MNLRWLTDFATKVDSISGRKAVVDPRNAGKERIARDGAMEIKVYEEAVSYFLLSLFPFLTMPQSYKAWQHLQQTISKYYAAGHHASDPTTATVTHNRANTLTEYGFTGDEIRLLECTLPVVSTRNAILTLYWLLLYILPLPSLLEKLPAEIAASAKTSPSDSVGTRSITLNISEFEIELPLLVSCYREILRPVDHTICNRRIMQDMTITYQDGQSYLLKKGVDIQLPAGFTHRHTTSWGPDAEQFRTDLFLASTSKVIGADRTRKVAYMPFGGGRHLCPGRTFAFAEIIGCAAVMLLGFDVEATGMGFEDTQMRGPRFSSSTVKPVGSDKGLGAMIKHREEFASVAWKFYS